MLRLHRFVGPLFLAALPACAVASVDDGAYTDGSDSVDGGEDGGDDGGSSGGSTNHSGGSTGTGGKASGGSSSGGSSSDGSEDGGSDSGGSSNDGSGDGGSTSGGGSSSGGTSSGGASSGGASSGGASSGGASSGGAGSGGAASGNCAGLPTHTEWTMGSGQMEGDQVVSDCQVLQSACAGKETGVDYIWECNQSHVDNCDQTPWGGTSWTFVAECD